MSLVYVRLKVDRNQSLQFSPIAEPLEDVQWDEAKVEPELEDDFDPEEEDFPPFAQEAAVPASSIVA